MPAIADDRLMRELERTEIAAWSDLYRGASRDAVAACGLHLDDRLGGAAGVTSAADVLALNRVLGLGLERAADAEDIDAIIELYESRAVPRFFVQVSPIARVPAEILRERGLERYNSWVKLYRDTAPPPDVDTDLEVRPIGATDAPHFGRVAASCFGWPEPVARWIAELVGRPGWRHYLAFDGDEPVATAALYIDGARAWLDFAATADGYRGRGAQSALLARRIDDAAALGCRLLVVETAEDRPEKPAPSLRNVARFGFQVAYVRPNYIWRRP